MSLSTTHNISPERLALHLQKVNATLSSLHPAILHEIQPTLSGLWYKLNYTDTSDF